MKKIKIRTQCLYNTFVSIFLLMLDAIIILIGVLNFSSEEFLVIRIFAYIVVAFCFLWPIWIILKNTEFAWITSDEIIFRSLIRRKVIVNWEEIVEIEVVRLLLTEGRGGITSKYMVLKTNVRQKILKPKLNTEGGPFLIILKKKNYELIRKIAYNKKIRFVD